MPCDGLSSLVVHGIKTTRLCIRMLLLMISVYGTLNVVGSCPQWLPSPVHGNVCRISKGFELLLRQCRQWTLKKVTRRSPLYPPRPLASSHTSPRAQRPARLCLLKLELNSRENLDYVLALRLRGICMRAALQLPERMSSDPGLDGPPFAEGFQPLQIKHQMKGTNTLCGASDGQVAAWQHDMYGCELEIPTTALLAEISASQVWGRHTLPSAWVSWLGRSSQACRKGLTALWQYVALRLSLWGHLTSNGFELECQAGFQMVVE